MAGGERHDSGRRRPARVMMGRHIEHRQEDSTPMTIVLSENRGPVRHVILNRPEKRNALNAELIAALRDEFADAADDRDVLCVVVRGAGPMFSSGIDVAALADLAADPGRVHGLRRPILEAWNLLEEMPKPTIAQIQGACLGAAMELALACDLRTMATDAIIGLPETRIGLIPDVGGSSRLPSIVGLGRAKELIMASRLVDGTEAERIGLANRIAAAEDLDETTDGLVAELLQCGPVAVAHAKRVLDAAAKPALAATLELEGTAQALCAQTEDFAEATRAFAEKRQPEFSGR
jgi:enoyl-CoA hydratase/carnithine racemase